MCVYVYTSEHAIFFVVCCVLWVYFTDTYFSFVCVCVCVCVCVNMYKFPVFAAEWLHANLHWDVYSWGSMTPGHTRARVHSYVHTCTHTYIQACMHAYVHARIPLYIHTFIPFQIPSYSCISFTWIHACTDVHSYLYTYVPVCTRVGIGTCIKRTHTHTHTHTHIYTDTHTCTHPCLFCFLFTFAPPSCSYSLLSPPPASFPPLLSLVLLTVCVCVCVWLDTEVGGAGGWAASHKT